MIRKFTFIFGIFFLFACGQKTEQKVDFIEVRISRYAVLEHASETLVLRKVDKQWDSILLGDGGIAGCKYQRIVQPKSNSEDLWQNLVNEGLLEIPEGEYTTNCCTDGSGYEAEIFLKTN